MMFHYISYTSYVSDTNHYANDWKTSSLNDTCSYEKMRIDNCTCYLVKFQYLATFDVMLIVFISVNVILSLISWWRCYANNYLHWGAYATWILLSIQGKIQCASNVDIYFFCNSISAKESKGRIF